MHRLRFLPLLLFLIPAVAEAPTAIPMIDERLLFQQFYQPSSGVHVQTITPTSPFSFSTQRSLLAVIHGK